MSEEELIAEAQNRNVSAWQRHKYGAMIGASIVVALVLVAISMTLYSSSGAAQLDLSRPGYVSVREQATQPEFDGYPATGDMSASATDQFRKLYDEQFKKATAIDSFGGAVLSDEALLINGE